MFKKIISVSLISVLLCSCGTILKSNQQNKPHSGKIDTTILVLDVIGLLFFLVPGVIAIAVDSMNGTIFLPLESK